MDMSTVFDTNVPKIKEKKQKFTSQSHSKGQIEPLTVTL